MLAYVIDPSLAASGVWTAIVIISVYWLGVLLSLRGGLGVVAELASSGVLIGTLIPGVTYGGGLEDRRGLAVATEAVP